MKRKSNRPLKISCVLNRVLEQAGALQMMEEKKLRDNWENLVGKRISQIAIIDVLKGERLFLKVENAVWKMELRFQISEIIQRANQLLGWKMIKEIILL